MVYNTTFMDTAYNIVDIFVGVGSSVDQPYLFGYMIMVAFFLIFLILSIRNDFIEVLIIDSFITTLIGILLVFAGLVPAVALAYPFVILILALLLFLFM